MPALNSDRMTNWRAGELASHPVEAGTRIYAGSLVCLNAAGNAVPGAADPELIVVGCAKEQVDNREGVAGGMRITVRRDGLHLFDTSQTDPVTRSAIGKSAYILDDQTVVATDGGGTLSRAGMVVDVVGLNGVWIEVAG